MRFTMRTSSSAATTRNSPAHLQCRDSQLKRLLASCFHYKNRNIWAREMPFGITEAFETTSGCGRHGGASAFVFRLSMSARAAAVSRAGRAAEARRLFP
jgi:hypothetical protein